MIERMPDTETFLYFAYGSNMFTRRLKERTPSVAVADTGFVEGHRLAFDKVSRDGSGKANPTFAVRATRD